MCRVISFLMLRESYSLYTYIYLFHSCFLRGFFAHTPIKYEWFFSRSSWGIDGMITSSITPGLSGSERNINDRILHTLQISRSGASPSDTFTCDTKHTSFSSNGVLLHPQKMETAYSHGQGVLFFVHLDLVDKKRLRMSSHKLQL